MKAQEAKKKNSNIFKEFFCFCDREPTEEPRSIQPRQLLASMNRPNDQSIEYSMQHGNFEKSITGQQLTANKWISDDFGEEQDIKDSYEMLIQIDRLEEEKLENRNLSYLSNYDDEPKYNLGGSEEAKTYINERNLLEFHLNLLIKETQQVFSTHNSAFSSRSSIGNLNPIKKYGKIEQMLLENFRQHKVEYKYTDQHEKTLNKNLIGEDICKYVAKRAGTGHVLISHDPTGSLVLQQLFISQQVFYLEESKMFSKVIDLTAKQLNIHSKLTRVIKSELDQKLDCAIISLINKQKKFTQLLDLTNHTYLAIGSIFREYLQFAHDIIMILPYTMRNDHIIGPISEAIHQSLNNDQVRNSAIELQMIYEGDYIGTKVLYFGEVADIKLSEELDYYYALISPQSKRFYKYKDILRVLRKKYGMLKILKLFQNAHLIENPSDENFNLFIEQLKINNLVDNRKMNTFLIKNPNHDGTSSQTESELDDECNFAENAAPTNKIHSKSEVVTKATFDYDGGIEELKRAHKSENFQTNLRQNNTKFSNLYIQVSNQYPD